MVAVAVAFPLVMVVSPPVLKLALFPPVDAEAETAANTFVSDP